VKKCQVYLFLAFCSATATLYRIGINNEEEALTLALAVVPVMNDQKRRPRGVPLDCLLLRGDGCQSSAMCIEPPSQFPTMLLLTNAFDAMMLAVNDMLCSLDSCLDS